MNGKCKTKSNKTAANTGLENEGPDVITGKCRRPESEGPNCTAWKMKDQANNIVRYKCYAYSTKILVAN